MIIFLMLKNDGWDFAALVAQTLKKPQLGVSVACNDNFFPPFFIVQTEHMSHTNMHYVHSKYLYNIYTKKTKAALKIHQLHVYT